MQIPRFDVVVVGGGPAGLSAALMLGRCRRRVLLCDVGEPRNRHSHALHGYLTRDGMEPRAFNELGRDELRKYDVEFRCVGVTHATLTDHNSYAITLADENTVEASFLLLATGVIDDLPGIPGFHECYGRSVFHCPYCDGWEVRDRHLIAFGMPRDASGLALSLLTWSGRVTLCTNGRRVDRGTRDRLARNGIAVRTESLARLDHHAGEMTAVAFTGGGSIAADALFFNTNQHPQSQLAIRLGCTLTRVGTVKTGSRCDTNVPRVFVAGDASRDAQFVVVAAAEGVKAAVAINRALQSEEVR
ncbi:MAG TPA: NAD(P)/FAD-dependent oxidoreductase [Vicinamibacterales bacterium]|nr:NAD(P)/FAD-dependent oxidoreductase [Vicinamibacterales bacterium]